MAKIPVGETVSSAYQFAFARILSVLGIFWFPYLIYGAIIAGSVYLFAPDLPNQIMHGPYDASIFPAFRRIIGIVSLVGIITAAMVTVGLQQQAQGIHKGPVFIYFSLGSAVWRMIGAIFLGILLMIVIGLVTVGVCVAVWFGANQIPQHGLATFLRVVTIIAAVCWMIYFSVRLWFLLPATVVAEGGIGLGRSWSLAGGNFWRIIGVWIVVFIPVATPVCSGGTASMIRFDIEANPNATPIPIRPAAT